jgi:hypothetical protein
MTLRFLRVIPIILFLSCGIHSFEYIGGATIIGSPSDTGFTFKIDSETFELTTGFLLYSRYYIEEDDKKDEFDDINS